MARGAGHARGCATGVASVTSNIVTFPQISSTIATPVTMKPVISMTANPSNTPCTSCTGTSPSFVPITLVVVLIVGAFLLGRVMQWVADANRAMGRGGNGRHR
jgi:hypothetical protein